MLIKPFSSCVAPVFFVWTMCLINFPYGLTNCVAQESLFVEPPTIYGNPNERVPLVAIVEFKTRINVVPEIEITDGQRTWNQPWNVPAGNHHRVAAIGLRPDHKYQIKVQVTAEDGQNETSMGMDFVTPPLPRSFPPLRTTVAIPEEMEPGITLFAVNLWNQNSSMLDYGYIVALNNYGEVVWFMQTGDRIADLRILDNGNLLYQQGSYRYAYEVDVLGRDVRCWWATGVTESPGAHAIPVDVDTMHHDLMELPNGNFLTLGTELVEFDEYPTSETDPSAPWEKAYVVCDQILEFDPTDGRVVDRLHLLDLLDKTRFGYMALTGFWREKYNHSIETPSRDWSHANALLYIPEEDAVIVALRHLDCMLKIDWKTKQIKWIFGDPDGWGAPWQKYLLKPKGDLAWPYHFHSPQFTPHGTIMMYDNGNYRARPFNKITEATENRSRVVEFRIDEVKMTVEQLYSYDGGDSEKFYCPFYCEADWLSNDNLLITDGGHIETLDGVPFDNVPGERQWARIFEISRPVGQPEKKVFEVVCDSPLGSQFGWSIYRAMRLPNMFHHFRLDPLAVDEKPLFFYRGPPDRKGD
ncbi:MAG: aryl-sulfate sulfotransferase [Planctomycetales bacterium]|nr:aryl-sulfate sulfotransferase [Planctomycetales bacterium]